MLLLRAQSRSVLNNFYDELRQKLFPLPNLIGSNTMINSINPSNNNKSVFSTSNTISTNVSNSATKHASESDSVDLVQNSTKADMNLSTENILPS